MKNTVAQKRKLELAKKIHKQRSELDKRFAKLVKKARLKEGEELRLIVDEVSRMGTIWLLKLFEESPDRIVAEAILNTHDIPKITKFIMEYDIFMEISGDKWMKDRATDIVLVYGKIEEVAFYIQNVSNICIGYVIDKRYAERKNLDELSTLAKLLNSPLATSEIKKFIVEMNGKTNVSDCLFRDIKPNQLDKKVKENPTNKDISGNVGLNSGLYRTEEETAEYIDDSLERDLP